MKITPVPPLLPAVDDAAAPPSAEAAPQPAPTASGKRPDRTKLADPSLVQQEPDLANETGLTAREGSGWAMAGSGLPE